MDLDIRCIKPFDELLKFQCVFPVEQQIGDCANPRFSSFCNAKLLKVLGQYAFGAEPKNPFMKKLCDTINNNIDNYIKTANSSHWYVYKSTGPDFVTDCYLNFSDKNSVELLIHKDMQKFGDYAYHNCFGTWK